MKALIDTCVIADVLQSRQPFCEKAQTVFIAAANNQFIGFMTAKSATDIYYLTHRYTHDDKASRAVLNKLFMIFDILDTSGMDCRRAIPSAISDFEDAVMVETAVRTEMDCIVTHNTKDFTNSDLPVFTPEEFLDKLAALEED